MKRDDLDERQLWIRGNVYKHMTAIMMVMLFINAFLTRWEITWAEGMYPSLITVLFAVAVGSLEMIFSDSYFPRGVHSTVWMSVIGLTATVSIVIAFVDYARGDKFIAAGRLTANGGFLIMALLLFSIFAGFAVKSAMNKRNEE